jgi:carbon starvation protein
MLYTGDISSIWPMFGVTNQTLAGLALAIGTTIILRISEKKIYALVTLVPCAFVSITTFVAGIMNVQMYLARNMMLNAVLSIVIIVLVTIIIVDNIRVWMQLLKTEKPIGMNTERDIIYCPIVPADRAPDDKPLA